MTGGEDQSDGGECADFPYRNMLLNVIRRDRVSGDDTMERDKDEELQREWRRKRGKIGLRKIGCQVLKRKLD